MSMTINSIANNNGTAFTTRNDPVMKRANEQTSSVNPSSIAISQRINASSIGLQQGTANAGTMTDLLRTAESGLSSINTSLQRIRELSLQSMNATTTAEDRNMIQGEINQMKSSINSLAENTQFNNMGILSGEFTNKNTASSAYGSGQQISIENMSSEDMGIANYDVTDNFNIADIDKAIDQVTETRSNIGSAINTMNTAINSNTVAQINLEPSRIRHGSANQERLSIVQNKNRILGEYQSFLQMNSSQNRRSSFSISM